MTSSIAINDKNDIYIGNDGNLVMSFGFDAILENCKTASQAQLGEMYFSFNSGMPNFQVTWNGEPNLQQFEAALYNTLISVSGVLGVTAISVVNTGGILSYTALIETDFGSRNINASL